MVSSAWEILRHRATVNAEYKMLWTKGLPLKISFFEWRLCKGKIPTDDLWKRNSYMVVSKCWCCVQPKEDSFQHLFLSSPTENRVWSTFAQAAGIIDNLVHVHQVIWAWWNIEWCPKIKPLYQVAPAVIIWEIWKRRNTIKYGRTMSCNRVIHEINKTLQNLAKIKYPWMANILLLWSNMIWFFEGYRPYVITKRITWQSPCEGWFKCNTDGASRENPGPSSYGFYVWNSNGDFIYAKAENIADTTIIVAEAKAIVEELGFCVN